MTKFNKLHSVVGAVYSGISAGASGLYTVGSAAYSSMSVANTVSNAILTPWGTKALIISEVVLMYESIVPEVIRDFALNASVNMKEAVVGDNYLTLLLNKGFEGFSGTTKFLASEFNSGMYKVATKMLPTIVKGLNKDIIEPIGDYLFIECLDIDPRGYNSEQEIFNHKNINNTIDTISMMGHYLRSTVLEYSKSDLELDSSNDNTAFDSIDLDSELYYSNPFVSDSELICSIG